MRESEHGARLFCAAHGAAAACAAALIAACACARAEEPAPAAASGPAWDGIAIVCTGSPFKPAAAAFCIDARGYLLTALAAVPGEKDQAISLRSPAFPAGVQASVVLVLRDAGAALLKSAKPFPYAFRPAGEPAPDKQPESLAILGIAPLNPEDPASSGIAAFPCRIAAGEDSRGTKTSILIAEKFPLLAGGPVTSADRLVHGMHLGGPRGLRADLLPASAVRLLAQSPLVGVTIAGIPTAEGAKPAIRVRALINPLFTTPDRAWLRFRFPEDRGIRMDLARDEGAFEGRFDLPDPALLTYHREEIRLELFWDRAGMPEPASAGDFPVSWEGPRAGAPSAPEGPNLAPNPGFEEACESAPKGWNLKLYQGFDGLTSFWEREEGRGMVVRVDTDVLLDEAYPRWKEMERPAKDRPPAGKKTPPGEKAQYKTVGANDGVHIVSDYIPVERDTEYYLSLDVFSAATGIKIFVDGYVVHGGRDRIVYRNQKSCGESPAEKAFLGSWHTYEWRFHPTRTDKGMPLLTEKIRIKLYAYWPRGEARFDNVVLRAAGKRSAPSQEAIEQPDTPFRKNPKIKEEGLEEDE